MNLKLFRNIFLILIAVYITTTIYIAFFPTYYDNVNNTRWVLINKTLHKKIDLSDSTINTLFIGDSRLNAAFNFKKIKNSWSFGMGGSTPIENYYLLKSYLTIYEKPETVFFSISPRFLSQTFAFWDLAVRNDFFSKNDFNEILLNYNNLQDTSLGWCPKTKYWLYKLNFITFYQEDLRNNLIFFGKQKNLQLANYVTNNRGKRPHPNLKNTCSELNYEVKMKNFAPAPIFDLYFNKVLKLCENEQIILIFRAMPMNESSFKKLKPKFIADYQKYMQQKQESFPQFMISNSLYSYPDSLFGDASHLNKKGTKIFTENFLLSNKN